MIFLERQTFGSLYRRSDGILTLVVHGTTIKHDWGPEVIEELWDHFESRNLEDFREHLRERLTDPDRADDLFQCYRCDNPGDGDYSCPLASGDTVCEDCSQHYYHCEDCEELHEWTTTTLHDTEICEDCRDHNYFLCEDCDGYYRDDCGGEHHTDCDCEAPAQSFTIRNDGQAPLSNDTRVTVSLPAGVISDEGIGTIARYLRDESRNLDDREQSENMWRLSFNPGQIGEKWQTKEGNFTKRLSRFAHKTYGLKITPEVLSRVGCIARDHSTAVDFELETTRNLNLSAYDFGHEESCWWQSYSESRCALKSNGGFGLRTFNRYHDVTGRAWVMPLKELPDGSLVPTLETQSPAAFVVFNGYGDLSGYAPARLMAHMAGMTYRKIGFSCSPMYVNNESGYLVAPEAIASRYDDGSLYLSTNAHSNLHLTERTLSDVAA